jgi:hypothetical protein
MSNAHGNKLYGKYFEIVKTEKANDLLFIGSTDPESSTSGRYRYKKVKSV